MKDRILALDQGTTSSRAIIFNMSGIQISTSRNDFPQYTPEESLVEHDAEEIWESQLKAAEGAIAGMGSDISTIACIGITNQRETTILWDKNTGKPVGRAIVWQCRRTAGICERLRKEGHEKFIQKRTGLKLDPYFSGTKINWMLEEIPGLREKAEKGEILFGTVDTWLLWKLTGGEVHATDVTNASRTMLMNLETGQWDEEMLRILDIPRSILPEIRSSIGYFGETDSSLFGVPIPITAMAGDQHAALFGHRAFEPGDVKNTYGTGCFMLMNTGDKPVYSSGGLLSTVAWGINGEIIYALEGSVFMAGALLLWLRDNLGIVDEIEDINHLAESIGNNAGVYLIPAYQGLGTPWWSSSARGTITGLTRASEKAHICRAALESIAYRSRDVIDVMISDSGYELRHMRVDGGVTNSSFLMKFQAGLLNIPVERPSFIEVTVLGAALMAGLGAGLWDSLNSLKDMPSEHKVFRPDMEENQRRELYDTWLSHVKNIT
jgi:glycerol kinase